MSAGEGRATATLEAPSIGDIRSARERIAGLVLRTPLVRLNVDDAGPDISLKLENLQPIGSFKIRGSGNAMSLADRDRLARGVYTASAGNMAQGVAWHARRLGVPCGVVVPETAPEAKLEAIRRLGAEFVKEPFDRWWQVMVDHRHDRFADRLFVHPFMDPVVMAGNGTIGLEIVEDLPDVDCVVVPWGGGGLSCGIAAAIRALKPETKVYGCEVETAAPLAASLAAGEARDIDYVPSFVDGIGAKGVMPEMLALATRLLTGSLVVSLADVAGAVKLLAERNRVVAEGAGAVPVAAALAGGAGPGKVACVVSGGNIDTSKLRRILGGEVPEV